MMNVIAKGMVCAIGLVAPDASAQAQFDCTAPSPPNATQPLILGDGTPGSVTTAQLQQALDGGGAIRLNVGAPS